MVAVDEVLESADSALEATHEDTPATVSTCSAAEKDALELIREIRRWGSTWTQMGPPTQGDITRLEGYLTRSRNDFAALMKCYPGFREQLDNLDRDMGTSIMTLTRGGGSPKVARMVARAYKDMENYFNDILGTED